ncbi:phosphodiesterase [Halomonas sp. GFAJ-1]|nr:hypothetical protein BB497_08930 [Halomonas sp. GFAJ-1]EHK61797.1 phosphodiesterase [Halomonas sp. GFAJ-1]
MNAHEQNRLFALRQLNLLDTSPSEGFDRITRMASQLFGLPIAAISLTDENRQGYLIAKPLLPDMFEKWLQDQRPIIKH